MTSSQARKAGWNAADNIIKNFQPANLRDKIKELKTENIQLRKVCENYIRHCRCTHQSVFGVQPKCPTCQEAEKLLQK